MKFLRELRKIAQQYGFSEVGRTSKGHFIWERNGFRVVTVSKSTSDPRTLQNTVKHFRRGEEYEKIRFQRFEKDSQNHPLR